MTRTCTYQGVGNVNLSGNFAYVLKELINIDCLINSVMDDVGKCPKPQKF